MTSWHPDAGPQPGSARWEYLRQGNAEQVQAGKRVCAKLVVADEGQILLVNPTYKAFWDLPGGMAEKNEPPRAVAAREFEEELGVPITVSARPLIIDWEPPKGPWDDQLVFVFGGTLDTDQRAQLRIADPEEIGDYAFMPTAEALTKVHRDVADRLRRAVNSTSSRANYFELGT
ncbi:NUDIX domain-containing protein [Saccharopolyspora phatthalungensis]|uniref:8-oxo-dGTP pyrophosphatase MutT (NUDIX family) n=1 Tax=Saccharopolyspora phatthalungensis TaxID=664693 RepID=A0A840QG11_9PSEU|nr:NUDIX hydrolase [Saccharopolyspora phatthalungensis]MBB5156073.1 8-oxo-dGTP pyrophosphatase MutT (NUDIX family) [Saccharopolyspora phatthalungensis]